MSSSATQDASIPIELGKRKRKGIEAFAITHEAKRPTREYKGGSGVKLGDIKEIQTFIKRHSSEELKFLHRICLDRPGTRSEVKKNLREFNGFNFEKDSEQYFRKRASLNKLTRVGLREYCEALNLYHTGSKEEMVDRILDFLLNPTVYRRRRSSATKTKSRIRKVEVVDNDDNTEEEEEEEEEVKVEENGEEEKEENEEEEKVEVVQVVRKRKKRNNGMKEAPTIKDNSKCKEPDDSELMETVKSILKDTDLNKATTKSVCLQVYAKYPGVDLSSRKPYVVFCIERVTATL